MSADDFMAPVDVAVRTTFITVRAAARHMIKQGSGVILAFGGPGDRAAPSRDYYLGGTQVAFDAIESIRRQASVELGPHGIRFVTLESGGVTESLPGSEDYGEIGEMIAAQTLLGRPATLEDVGNRCHLGRVRQGARDDRGDAECQRRCSDRLARPQAGRGGTSTRSASPILRRIRAGAPRPQPHPRAGPVVTTAPAPTTVSSADGHAGGRRSRRRRARRCRRA